MKIGILTITPNIGYGGIMQAYALQSVLSQEGHDVWIINNRTKTRGVRFLMRVVKRTLQKFFLKKDIAIFISNEYLVRSQFTQPFIDRYMHLTEVCYTSRDLRNLCKNNGFELLVVGSDQVWRPKYVSNIEDYFFSFAASFDNIKKIAYAASFGVDEWEYTEQESFKCSQLIRKFSAVSVREDSAVSLVNNNLQFEAIRVLDPTLLLNKSYYIKLVQDAACNLSVVNDVFTYILDMTEDKMDLVKQVTSVFSCEATHFNTNAENKNAPLKERVAPPVESWLNGFKEAKYIVTDSFHGCAFSIIFNKPFYIYGNKKRGLARFSSLLKMLNLEDRLILDSKSLTSEMIVKKIDWDHVNSILGNESDKALAFLRRAMEV
ncbi:MAG: polysaccharide pyruvyl transferase family protein [Dysgonomonas sp.]